MRFYTSQNYNESEECNEITSEQYFATECGTLNIMHAQHITHNLNSGITQHALVGKCEDLNIDNDTLAISQTSLNSESFLGILIDTGAAGKSTAGLNQYKAF